MSEAGTNSEPAAPTVKRVLEICNKKGLHARASAKFVMTVEQFDAQVFVTRGSERVGGTSIMGLMMLAAGPGTSITVEASGPQAAEVVEALATLVAGRFTEGEELPQRYKEIFISLLRCPALFAIATAQGRPRGASSFRSQHRNRHVRFAQRRRRRLRRPGHWPCRMGPQGNRHRRDRDARADGDAR